MNPRTDEWSVLVSGMRRRKQLSGTMLDDVCFRLEDDATRIAELDAENAELRDLCGRAYMKMLPVYEGTTLESTALLMDALKLAGDGQW